jgi:hypothetical protein
MPESECGVSRRVLFSLKAIVCDNLKAAVVKALWFEPTLNQTFAAMAEHKRSVDPLASCWSRRCEESSGSDGGLG